VSKTIWGKAPSAPNNGGTSQRIAITSYVIHQFSTPIIGGGGGLLFLILAGCQLAPPDHPIAAYTTSVAQRTPRQKHNATLAATHLTGKVIPAGGVFSFNSVVKGWSADMGYVKAPVSYDGDLIPAFGGGVCQTSTTLYNAALIAGLEVVERHHHVFAPHYVTPGRDAAVAYPGIDLRLRNPYSFPIRIEAKSEGSRLTVTLHGAGKISEQQIQTRIIGLATPNAQTRHMNGTRAPRRGFARRDGATGFRVVTSRVGGEKRETLSDDVYPAMPEVHAFAQK
jgi:vancomycin resistance protein VanW